MIFTLLNQALWALEGRATYPQKIFRNPESIQEGKLIPK